MNRPCLWTASPSSPLIRVLHPPHTPLLRDEHDTGPRILPLPVRGHLARTKSDVVMAEVGGDGTRKKNSSLKIKKAIKKDLLKKVVKKMKQQQSSWKKCWREVWSSVDWRHFGTERRPHTWHHAQGREGGREGGKGWNDRVLDSCRDPGMMEARWRKSTWRLWRKRPASPQVNAVFRRGGGEENKRMRGNLDQEKRERERERDSRRTVADLREGRSSGLSREEETVWQKLYNTNRKQSLYGSRWRLGGRLRFREGAQFGSPSQEEAAVVPRQI